LCITR